MTILDLVPARVLAIYAHPDDPEVSCGGTLARWSAAGSEVDLVVCNAGDKGSSDPSTKPETLVAARADEVAAAAAVMGLAGHVVLGIPDGEIENTVELRAELVGRIRARRPDLVVAPDPTAVFFGDAYVNHHDHRAVGWAVLDACAPMAAGPLYFPEAGPAHQVGTVLLSGTLEPDCWVDIAETLATKLAAVACHRTQLPAGDHADALVEEVVRIRAEEAGEAAGLRLAEGFRRLAFAG
ncbi:MAG: PIG-L deacetylase family protein [Acidimicrobiales bacterium]